jgi:SAM-dependent methyltransferase/antitoxin (DNA-binding transcriptional repressor) of toxin-antitoxin stability system
VFLSPWFAIAGLVAAAGPVVIHMLNRRRFRTVEWAAMDLLREAMGRTRRFLRLRDLLLLLLRTACVLLFALALARPYFRSSGPILDSAAPVHAVLVIDNSLSMAHRSLNRSALDEARRRAAELIDDLAAGSRISVVPLCGADTVAGEPLSAALASREDALEAVEQIVAVDRRGSVALAIELAADACAKIESPAAKRIFLLTDNQAINWPADPLAREADRLPAPMQIIHTAADEAANSWVDDFFVQDDVADAGTPATFVATIAHEGPRRRRGVEVTLSVDGEPVASQSIDLEPGQKRQVIFPPYQFNNPLKPGQFTTAVAEVGVTPDRLPDDDRLARVVPVVAALPAVFIDRAGPAEDPARGRYGETYWLRRLLAPRGPAGGEPLVSIRHTTVDRLDRAMLEDARLVVLAGVADPDPAVDLLWQYVRQGGALVIAAGGAFDPVQWNEAAWASEARLLPLPLADAPQGRTPDRAGAALNPFQLDPATMLDPWFRLAQASDEALADLYRLPFFFKTVVAEENDRQMAALADETARHTAERRAAVEQIERSLKQLTAAASRGPLTPGQEAELERWRAQRDQLQPRWLLWADQLPPSDLEQLDPHEVARREQPRVLARYTTGLPFLVRRNVGRGTVVLLTSGIGREWNTLITTNAVLLLDRLCRQLIERSLPKRNVGTSQRMTIPVPAAERRNRFVLTNPRGERRELTADALGSERYGLPLTDLAYRGVYRLSAYRPVAADGGSEPRSADAGPKHAQLWEIALAAAGPAEESNPAVLTPTELSDRLAGAEQMLADAGPLAAQASVLRRQHLWRWLLAAVLCCLLAEILLLSWRPAQRGQTT